MDTHRPCRRGLLSISLGLALAAVGCSTAPVSVQGIAPRSPSDAFACAMNQLNALDYTVADADREAGFIRGRKQTSGLATTILTGSNYHDVLTVAVFEDQTTDQTAVRVTAARIEEDAEGLASGSETGVAPSDSAEAEANRIVSICADTEGQASDGSRGDL